VQAILVDDDIVEISRRLSRWKQRAPCFKQARMQPWPLLRR
jgi:hypothetical protein